MTEPANLKDDLAELRRTGDPRLTDDDRRILKELTAGDDLGQLMDALTVDDADLATDKT